MFLKSLFPFLACVIVPTTINAAGVGPEKDEEQVKRMIVGGKKAEIGRYDYFARDLNGMCGGFLISPNIVLTAASCNGEEFPTFNRREIIVLGSYDYHNYNNDEEGRDYIEIKETIIHPDYDSFANNYLDNDYMLVVLERDSIIQPVIIPENDDFLKTDDQVYAIGMGAIDSYIGAWSDDLLEVDLNYIANDRCDELYSGIYSRDITNNMLCTLTPNKDTCWGDTGGPLIKRGEKAEDDVVVGITSFGVGCASGLPGVFARVSSGYKWIKKTVEANGGKLVSPKTAAPTTAAPTTAVPCANLKKRNCKNECVFSKRQRQCLPKKYNFEHNCAQYEGKTPCLEVKVCKFPDGKCVHRCDGKSAQRCKKHKFCNLDKVVNPCFGCQLVTACGARR